MCLSGCYRTARRGRDALISGGKTVQKNARITAFIVGVALGVHSPIDIVGSFVIALTATATVGIISSVLGKRNLNR